MSDERNLTAESLAEQLSSGLDKPVGMIDMTTVTSVAGTASNVLTNAMQFEPMVAGMVSMFFPPAAVAQPFIVMAMPFVIRALGDISKSNGGDMMGAFLELAQHLTAGQQNSPVLSGVAGAVTKVTEFNATVGAAVSHAHPPHMPPSQDPSAQGSG